MPHRPCRLNARSTPNKRCAVSTTALGLAEDAIAADRFDPADSAGRFSLPSEYSALGSDPRHVAPAGRFHASDVQLAWDDDEDEDDDFFDDEDDDEDDDLDDDLDEDEDDDEDEDEDEDDDLFDDEDEDDEDEDDEEVADAEDEDLDEDDDLDDALADDEEDVVDLAPRVIAA